LGISNNKLKVKNIPLHCTDKGWSCKFISEEGVNIRKLEKIGNIEGVSPQIGL
jgi:hypothetical protein